MLRVYATGLKVCMIARMFEGEIQHCKCEVLHTGKSSHRFVHKMMLLSSDHYES